MNRSNVLSKYCDRSEFLKTSKQGLLNSLKSDGVDEDHALLKTVLKNILSDDEAKIKDNYAGFMIYLHYFSKKLTFNDFTSCLEEQLGGEGAELEKPFGIIIIYGALVKSSCILSWANEDQYKVLCKLLHYAKNFGSLQFIVFDYLNDFVNNCKTDSFLAERILTKKKNLSKTSTCFQLYFFLKLEKRFSDNSGNGSEIIKNMSPDLLSQIILNNCEGFLLFNDLSSLLCNFLLPDLTCTVNFWEALIFKYHESPDSSKCSKVLILLTCILKQLSPDNYDSYLEKLFSSGVFKLIQISNNVFNDILPLYSKALKGATNETKLVLFNTLLTSCIKFNNKSNNHGFMEQIVSNLTSDGVTTVAKIYLKIIKGQMDKTLDSGSIKFTDKEKVYFVHSYGRVLSHPVYHKDVKLRKKGVQNLFSLGFLAEHSIIVPSEVATAARKVFFSCLLQRCSRLVDYINILDNVVSTVTMKISDGANFVVPVSSQIRKHWDFALKILKSIQDDSITDNLVVFQVVTLYMMLYLFKSEKIAGETIKEVSNVLKHAREKSSEDIHWTEVMVDVFLHLLSMPQESHRQFICCIFGSICNIMTPKSVELILSAVNPMCDSLSEDESENEIEGSDSELDDKEENETGEESNSEGEDSSSDIEESPNEKLRMALRDELFKIDTASTCGSVDLDELDENEGKQLNITLGKVFKDQIKGKSKIDGATIDFKIRALDLLSVFADHQPAVETIFNIVSRLVKYLKCSVGVKDLQTYSSCLKKCFKAVIGSVKITDSKEYDIDFLNKTFDKIIACDCPKSIYQEISPEVADCCLLIVKILYSTENFKAIVKKLNGVIDSYFSQQDTYYSHHLLSSIVLSASPAVPYLLSSIVDYAFSSEIKSSKKYQATDLLCNFFKNKRFYVTSSQKLNKKISKAEKKIIDSSLPVLKGFESGNFSSKCSTVLFELLLSLTKKLNYSEENQETLSPLEEALKAQFESMQRCIVGKKGKNSFKQLCRVFSIGSQAVPSKRKLKKLNRVNKSSLIGESNIKENGEMSGAPSPKKKKRKSLS